ARKICGECKEQVEFPADSLENLGMTPEQIHGAKIFKGRGCKVCGESGYKGRIALYEVMPFTDPLKELVLQGASAAELKTEMIRGGTNSLRMAGINKVLDGMTTPEEVMRCTVED